MLARTPADPFFESVAEDEGILVADLMGDGLDLQAGGGEQLIGYITPKSLERRFPELYGNISQGDGDD